MIKDLSQEEAGRWFNAAPRPVQDMLGGGEVDQKIEALAKKYALHVDTAGTLQKLTGYMMVGYIDPQQFLGELTAAGIDPATARKLIGDINTEIFQPLQQKMRAAGAADFYTPGPIAPALPVQPIIAQPPPTLSAPKVPAPPVPKPPVPPPANLPGTPLADALAKAGIPAAARPIVPAPAPRVNLLADHEEPHINLAPAMPKAPPAMPRPAVPAAPRMPQAPQQPSMSVYRNHQVEAAAPNTPAAPAMPPRPPMPPPQAPPLPQSAPAAPSAPIKYNVDPYREPLE